MKIYTKTGDDGTTSLAGGQRVPKHSERIEAYGTVDELISWVGLVHSIDKDVKRKVLLQAVQSKLMHCAAILASGPGANTEKMVPPTAFDIEILEKEIDNMESELEKLSSFVLPGGSIEVSEIHICRTVCRRAERSILRASTSVDVDPLIIKYINRLSDFMFVLARKVAKESGNEQLKWIP